MLHTCIIYIVCIHISGYTYIKVEKKKKKSANNNNNHNCSKYSYHIKTKRKFSKIKKIASLYYYRFKRGRKESAKENEKESICSDRQKITKIVWRKETYVYTTGEPVVVYHKES